MKPTAIRSRVGMWLASVSLAIFLCSNLAVGQTAEDAAVTKAEAAAAKATADKVAAEKALPAAIAAAKAAEAAAAEAKAAADKAKAIADKAAADKVTAEKAVAASIAAEKAAIEQIAAAKIAAIKAAARRVAQAEIAKRKAALDKIAADVAAKDAEKIKAFTDKAIADKIARDTLAAEKAQVDKAEAEKALAEKTAAVEKAKADVNAAAAAAKKAPEDKELAQKATAAEIAFSRAERDQTNAANALRSQESTLRSVTAELDAGKDVLEKIAAAKAGNAPKDADAAKKAIQAIETYTTTAVTQAIDKEKVAHEQAVAAKAVAERALPQKVATTKTATDKVAATKAVAEKAVASKTAAEKAVSDSAAAVQATAEKAAAAKAAADKAAADLAAANKLVSDKAAVVKATAEAVAAEKSEANTAAAAKAAAEKADADKSLAEKTKVAETANSQLAAAKTDAEKAVAQKAAADKTLAERIATDKAAATSAATAVAALEAATAAEKAARTELASKDPQIKDALARYYEAVAIVEGGLKPLATDKWDYAKARHLLCRAGFGGTPEEVEQLYAMGLHAAVEYLVDYDQRPTLDLPFNATLPEPTIRNENRLEFTRQRELINRRRAEDGRQQNALRDWWLQRMVQSPRPLQEKLVLFWHGHFATEYQTVRDSYALAQQNDLLRQHAAGNFGALLHGIAQDPAMLRYLDNNSNIKGRPNENFAREIMELFSMGEGNYTEEDIMEGARALTGYTYDNNSRQFRFIVSRHDTENKTIFGRTGNYAGDDFVDLILQQPFTPQFVARKQFVFFGHENPSDETVSRLAAILKGHQYDLGPMLKNLFMSEEFYSDETIASQIKSPVQLMVGTLRDLGIKEVSFSTLGSAVAAMGQELYGPPNVKGWEGGQFWVNANRIFVRYNGVADLVENIAVPNQPRGLDIVGALEGKKIDTPEQVVQFLAKSCFVQSLSEDKQKVLTEQVASLPPRSEWENQRSQVNAKLRMLLVLMMSMPEYQCT